MKVKEKNVFIREGGGEKEGVTWQLALADLTGWFNRMFGESGRGRGGGRGWQIG